MTTAALTRDDVLDFEVAPMQAALGAEVRGLDLRRLNDATLSVFTRHGCITCCWFSKRKRWQRKIW